MRIKRRRLGRVDSHFGCQVVPIGHVYDPRSILPSQAGVPTEHASSLRVLFGSSPEPIISSIAGANNRQEKGDGSDQLGGLRRTPNTRTKALDVVVVKSNEGILGVSQG